MRLPETVVVDASAVVDLLVGTKVAIFVRYRLERAVWAAPAHIDADVFSAFGRLSRAGVVTAADIDRRLALLRSMPLTRHLLPGLLTGAWNRRAGIGMAGALYVELATQLQVPLVTTDRRLANTTPLVEAILG
jgi:predicted nucleic acid-binding protein